MNGYNLLLVVHILAAAVWLGGGLVLFVIGLRARSDAALASGLSQLLPFVGVRLLMPAVVLLPVTGVWMVLIDSQWSFGQEWTRAAIGLFVVALLIGGVYLSRVGIAMSRASAAADVARALDRWLIGYAIVVLVLLVTIADMVLKPGAS